MTQAFPLSFKDVISLQELVYNLRQWCYQLGPTLKVELDRIITEVNEELELQFNNIEGEKAKWELLFNEFMGNIDARLQALNDQAMANLIKAPASLTRIELDKLYASRAQIIAIQGDMDAFRISTNASIAAFKTETNAAMAAFQTSVNTELGNFVRKSTLMFNVKDYGAKGDGTTSDSASVQLAVNALKAAGGGHLFYPPGEYNQPDMVFITSNMEISGSGATIVKKKGASTYVVFGGSTNGVKGYGAGASNIYLHDLDFRGKFGTNAQGLCALALFHSDNVTVRRTTFTECSGGGHRFDLGGCRFVSISDSVFKGFDSQLGSTYNEDIQPDYCTYRSGSFIESNVNGYDGLPSRFIHVSGNTWLPLTIGSTTYPAANPFGTHGTVQNVWISDLVFENNYVTLPVSDDGNVVPGTLHFVGVKNVRVENNVIDGTNNPACGAIMFYQATGGQDPAHVGDNSQSIAYVSPMRCENIVIKGNRVEGYQTTVDVIRVKGSAEARAFNVTIKDNLLVRMNESEGVENTGAMPITLDYVQYVDIMGNDVRQSRRLAYLTNCYDVKVHGNTDDGNAVNNLTLGDCNRVSVLGNTFTNVKGFGVYAFGTDNIIVSSNVLSSASGAQQPMIRIGDAPRFTVIGNVMQGFTGSLKGIEITGASTGVVTGNSARGFTTPLFPAETTGGIQVGMNAV